MSRALFLAVLALLCGCPADSEHVRIEGELTDVNGALTCLHHGYDWYGFDAQGLVCHRRERPGSSHAEATIITAHEEEL